MGFLPASEMPYVILLLVALAILIGALIFHRARKPIDHEDDDHSSSGNIEL